MSRGEPMRFAALDHGTVRNRCGICFEPYYRHRARLSGDPTCPHGGTVYREGTEEELSAEYDRQFPNGPEPIATFRADNPEDLARAKKLLSPESMNLHFGPGGDGYEGFMAALKDSFDD